MTTDSRKKSSKTQRRNEGHTNFFVGFLIVLAFSIISFAVIHELWMLAEVNDSGQWTYLEPNSVILSLEIIIYIFALRMMPFLIIKIFKKM